MWRDMLTAVLHCAFGEKNVKCLVRKQYKEITL